MREAWQDWIMPCLVGIIFGIGTHYIISIFSKTKNKQTGSKKMASSNFYRNAYNRNQRSYSSKTKVTLTWNPLIQIYDLKFNDTKNWHDIQGVIIFLKSIPTDERDYDTTTKVWGIHEKHFVTIKTILEHVANFEVIISEKPVFDPSSNNNQGFSAAIVPLDKCIQDFEQITGAKLQAYSGQHLSYGEAKRIYFKACLRLHPDKNPGDEVSKENMIKLNVAWNELQVRHFQVKEFAKQEA